MIKKIWLCLVLFNILVVSCSLPSLAPSTPPSTPIAPPPIETESVAQDFSTTSTPSGANGVPENLPETPQSMTPGAQATVQGIASSPQSTPVNPAIDLPPFILQPGTPVFGPNFLRPDLGCNYSGIGGQVFNSNGQPVTSGLVIEVDGSLEGQPVLVLGLNGDATGLGPGGFLLDLSDHVVNSTGQLWIQVFDLNGVPQTDQIHFDTRADCNQNLVIMNFTELGSELTTQFYFPLIFK